MNEIAAMRQQIEELEERNRQLEELLRGDDDVPAEWGLTKLEKQIYRIVASRKLATYEALFAILYGADPNGGRTINLLKVKAHHLRKKLEPFGIEIETVWGQGYRLKKPQEDRL